MTEPAVDPRDTARIGLLRSYRASRTTTWIETRGRSMSPLIVAGSRVLVEFGATPDQVGQIVVFERDGDIVAHRIVGRRRRAGRELLLPKGDAEPFFDRLIGANEVLGVVRGIEIPGRGSIRRRGIGGRSSRAIAGVSHWSGRGARFARQVAVRSPDPIGPAALRAIRTIARVPTRLIAAPITQIYGAERR